MSHNFLVFGKANTLKSELLDLVFVDLTIAIKVELVKSLFGLGESGSSSVFDFILPFRSQLCTLR